MVRFLAKKTLPKAPLLMGLMMSKSLMDEAVGREEGAAGGILGESGMEPAMGLLCDTLNLR